MVTDLLRSRSPAGAAAAPGRLVRRDASCAEIWLPAPPPAYVTSSVTPWVPGNFVLMGTPAQEFVLNYGHVLNFNQVPGPIDSTVGFVYGIVATHLDAAREVAPFFLPGPSTTWALPLSIMCQPVSVPAGEPISVYAATEAAVAYTFEAILLGWLGGLPTFDTIPLAVLPGHGYWLPSDLGTGSYTVTTGAGWAWGAPVTVVASMNYDALVVGIKTRYSLSVMLNPATFYQIGYGPAGSETWCATISMGHPWHERWIWPPVQVKAGERLAIRATTTSAQPRLCQLKLYGL